MLTKEEKKLWVEALRTGKFPDGRRCKQGQGKLRTGEDNYCCLGVACELFLPGEGENGMGEWRYLGETGVLPAQLVDKIGIPGSGALPERGGENSGWKSYTPTEIKSADLYGLFFTLAEANDNPHGLTFPEIADFLDKWLATED